VKLGAFKLSEPKRNDDFFGIHKFSPIDVDKCTMLKYTVNRLEQKIFKDLKCDMRKKAPVG
jgi:hypothetical protein